jgi:hypothetical protein
VYMIFSMSMLTALVPKHCHQYLKMLALTYWL